MLDVHMLEPSLCNVKQQHQTWDGKPLSSYLLPINLLRPNWDTSSEFGGAGTVTCTSRYIVLACVWTIGSYLFGTLVNASNTIFVLRDGRLFTNAQSTWGACGQNTAVANRGESISQPYWEALVSSLVTTPGVSVHPSVLEMPAPLWK